MSDQDEDLELQALQRRLDDAFATTRPRRGFEDELWARMQSTRPATNRFRDALGGFWMGVRQVEMPYAAVATVLILVISVGFIAYAASHLHFGGGASNASMGTAAGPRGGDQTSLEGFGLIPSPVFSQAPVAAVPSNGTSAANYSGPVQLAYAGPSILNVTGAPVFRYREPSTTVADRFASALGTVMRGRPQGFLGSYASSDYTLKVRGTIQSPPSSPAYFIFASLSMQAIEAAGASPVDLANIFLAEHNLTPQWSFTNSTDQSGDPVKVLYERQFQVGGYGLAYLVDTNGSRYGLEVDLSNNRPVVVSGMLPLELDGAYYNLASPAAAIQPALSAANNSSAPTLLLNQVDLVYVLVPAGGQSFFEPAFMFTGALVVNGVSYTRRILEPAVAPSQRKP